jgi:hypothetical protein
MEKLPGGISIISSFAREENNELFATSEVDRPASWVSPWTNQPATVLVKNLRKLELEREGGVIGV